MDRARKLLMIAASAGAVWVGVDQVSAGPVGDRAGAAQLIQLGRYSEAQTLAERLVREAPTATNRALLGACLLRRALYEAAETELRQATAAEPDHPRWLEMWAESLSELGRCEEAIVALDRAIALDPTPRAWFNRAMCDLDLGAIESSDDDLRAVLSMNPDHLPALIALGRVRSNDGDDREAVVLLTRAVRLAPDDAEALFLLGQAHRRLGDNVEAVHLFEAAVARIPGHSGALYGLARSLAALGRKDEAEEVMRRFREVQPVEEQVANLREYLAQAAGDVVNRARLTRLLLDLGRTDEASREAAIARRLAPDDPEIMRLQAAICALTSDPDCATRPESETGRPK